MSKGNIIINRDFSEEWLWKGEKYTKGQAWIDILLSAEHEDNYYYGFIARGTFHSTYTSLSEKYKWSYGTVRRFFKKLENYGMIEIEKREFYNVFTVRDFDKYSMIIEKNETER